MRKGGIGGTKRERGEVGKDGWNEEREMRGREEGNRERRRKKGKEEREKRRKEERREEGG